MRISFLGTALAACVLAGVALGSPAAAQAQGTTVVVIDISYIFKNHVRFKEAQDAMKKEVEQFEEKIRIDRDAITKMAEQLKAVQPDSPDYKRLEEQIAEATGKLQLETSRARKDFLQREAKLFHDTYEEVSSHVATFARQQNIGLVLRFSSEPIDSEDRAAVLQGINRDVVYQNQLNITPHILQQINRGGAPQATAPQQPGRQAFGPGAAPR
ncbi:MAG: OmpH family outer membrane protein [Planctomycetes bacterium]|nr:OmpH family outer membrane protein [Planctomycetota bacterium]